MGLTQAYVLYLTRIQDQYSLIKQLLNIARLHGAFDFIVFSLIVLGLHGHHDLAINL